MSKKSTFTSDKINVRVFKNPLLHFLSMNHISVPLSIFYSIGIFLTYWAISKYQLNSLLVISLFLTGVFVFSLAEYLIHRFVYHLPVAYEEGNIAFTMHGIHHKYPRDKKRLVMPPVVSIFLAILIFVVNFYVIGIEGMPFTAGFLFGYAAYLSIHYIIHRFKPPKNFLRQLWLHHSIHHYKDDSVAFGVSSPLWDYVFGTMPDKKV